MFLNLASYLATSRADAESGYLTRRGTGLPRLVTVCMRNLANWLWSSGKVPWPCSLEEIYHNYLVWSVYKQHVSKKQFYMQSISQNRCNCYYPRCCCRNFLNNVVFGHNKLWCYLSVNSFCHSLNVISSALNQLCWPPWLVKIICPCILL